MKLYTKDKQLESYNNYLLWILREVFYFRLVFISEPIYTNIC